MFLTLLASCATGPTADVVAPPARSLARGLPDGELTLMVTDPVVPGRDVGLRVVGGLPSAPVRIYAGPPGQLCPPLLGGDCLALTSPLEVAALTTDAAGQGRVTIPMGTGIPIGTPVVFQAVLHDGVGGHASNAVDRQVGDPAAFRTAPGGNILILLADDVGVDHVGAYGIQSPSRTPVIDQLAAHGTRFENAWALPLCGPTRAALATGRYPRRTGMGHNIAVFGGEQQLDPEQITIAEIVEYSPWYDYTSSFVGKWHLASWWSTGGVTAAKQQGWDWFSGHPGNLEAWYFPPYPTQGPGYYYWQKIDDAGALSTETTYITTDNVDDAIARMATMPEPWILQVSFYASHKPFDLPPPWLHTDTALSRQSSDVDKVDAIVEALDTEIGRLFAAMPRDVQARTNIFFIGDNGTTSDAIAPPLDPTRDKGTLYDGGVHVPFIVAGPAVGAPGVASSSLVSVVDVLPTIADLTGVDTGELLAVTDRTQPLALDGLSLLPVLADPATPVHDVIFAEGFHLNGSGPYTTDTQAIRDDRYKIIVDRINDRWTFYEYLPGALDEGPDLLPCGLTPEQQAAFDALAARLDELVAAMPYDNAPWPDPPAQTGDTGGTTSDTGAPPTDTSDTGSLPACAGL